MNVRCLCLNLGLFVGASVLLGSPAVAADGGAAREVRSPDGKIAITIHTDAPLGYSITVDGKPLLVRSRLGLELADDVKLGEKPTCRARSGNRPTLIGRTCSARTATCGIITMN